MPGHSFAPSGTPNDSIVAAVRDETHLLLGRTITYDADDWAAPTRLPGWTRSHIAAHLVQGARGLLAGTRGEFYDADAMTDWSRACKELELAALADGLSLQIDLDTTAGELDRAMQELEGVSDIPTIRLYEVVLHTFDLDLEADSLHVEPQAAVEMLRFRVDRLALMSDPPKVRVVSDEGFTAVLGDDESPAQVWGPAADLVLWLSRGFATDNLRCLSAPGAEPEPGGYPSPPGPTTEDS